MIRVFFRRVLDAYRTEYAYSIEITPSASKQSAFPGRFIRAEQKHTLRFIIVQTKITAFFLAKMGEKAVF